MQCCDAIRLPGQPQTVNFLLLYCREAQVPQVVFIFTYFCEQRTWTLLSWRRAVVLNGACGTCCSWTQVYNAACCFSQHLLYGCDLIDCRDFPAIASRGVWKLSFGKGQICQRGIYTNEKCVHCSNLRELGLFFPRQPLFPLSLSLSPTSVSHIQTPSNTHKPQHIFSTHTIFIPPPVTVKWLNILINCI